MTCYLSDLMGAEEENPSVERMQEVLSSLRESTPEHPDVSLSHESQWTLSAYKNGLLVWENVQEDDPPRHQRDLSPDQILALWLKLSDGDFEAIDQEPWLDGYGNNLNNL